MPVKKEPTVKSAPSKRKVARGDRYVCGACGFSVIVDDECGCEDVHEIICCGKPMTERKRKAAK